MNISLPQYDLLLEIMCLCLGFCFGVIPSLLIFIVYERYGKVPQALLKAQSLLNELETMHPSNPDFMKKLNEVKELQKLWS